MKHFHQNHKHRATDTEKKGRKLKTYRSEEICKCFTPLVKLHWHDCPVLRKPCPIHDNYSHQSAKQEKVEPEQNITISFHPSSKTERLFQPVKSLLTHCNPDTKINFQYYSPKDFTSEETVKHQFIQTTPEEIKRTSSNNVFVEKTKSFVADKTNKMKKLKQCFHSPCNSIVQKTRSHTSVTEKINDVFRERERQKPQAFFKMAGEEPPDVKYDSDFESFPCNKLGFKDLRKLSNEKRDSDFITVTHQGKNNVINHKIFEIKHKKGLNDINFMEFTKQTPQFVYSTFNSNQPGNKTTDQNSSKSRKFSVFRKPTKEINDDADSKDDKFSSSEKCETSSSGSLYITPFVLLPEMEENGKRMNKVDEAVQAEEKRQITLKQTQTSLENEIKESYSDEKPKAKNVSLQTLPLLQEKYSQYTKEIFLHDFDPSEETLDDRYNDSEKPFVKRSVSDESFSQKKLPDGVKEKKESSKYTKTTEVQTTSGYRYKEVLITRWDRNLKHETSQTEPLEFHVSERYQTSESKFKKQLTFIHKETQTSFFTSSEFSEISKFTTLDFSNATMVISSDQPEMNEFPSRMKKIWLGKSYSESDLYKNGKCVCMKTENLIPIFQSCLCKNSDLSPYMSSIKESFVQSTSTKVFETNTFQNDSRNYFEVRNTGLDSKKTAEDLQKKEQTSKKEDLTAAISDLSELKRIIQEFFEKAEFSSKKSQEKETATKEPKVDSGTMTDSLIEKPKQKLNAEAQTTIQVLLGEEETEKPGKSVEQKVKFRRSVLLDDESQTKTFFICALCGREMNTSVNVSTNTDRLEKHPKMNGKTTVVDTEYSETITVKTIKKTQNANASKDLKVDTKPIAFPEKEITKTLKRGQSLPQSTNSQKSGIPVPVFSGLGFSKNDDRVSLAESRKPETFTVDWEKQRLTTSHSKPKSFSQKPLQPIKQCFCDDIPETSSGSHKTSFIPGSSVTSKSKPKTQLKADTYPTSSKPEHPELQWKNSELVTNKTEKKASRRPDEYIYPVIIKPLWPKDFMRTWESMEKSDDSMWISSNQKRGYDKDSEPTDVPSGKKIKAVSQEQPKECFQFGKPALSNPAGRRQHKASLKKSTGFIWIPTSASQIFSKKNLTHQCKTAKSEESIKIKHQGPGPGQTRMFNAESSNDVFSVKRCHLKRIPFENNERSFHNQSECGCCKSLANWKIDKHDVSCPPRSSGKHAYQFNTLEDGSLISVNQTYKQSPTPRFENYVNDCLEECSCLSEGEDTPETSENNFSEISEVSEEKTHSHSQEPSLNSRSQTLEGSFYFDVDTSEKSFWINKN